MMEGKWNLLGGTEEDQVSMLVTFLHIPIVMSLIISHIPE
jgi:hypothetical protein